MPIRRFIDYFKRHGPSATLRRIELSLKRAMTGNRLVIYYCDFASISPETTNDPNGGSVHRKDAPGELSPQEMAEMGILYNSVIDKQRMNERFEKGASLWLYKIGEKIAGYGWTIAGRTIEPHYFPLGANDVHLFDYFVLPEFRGRRINPLLVNYILSQLVPEKKQRAFIEAAEWNSPQLSSLGRTPFKRLGKAWKYRLFGRTFVVWHENR